MQQRRLRLGDILDDYCPRERRITNHVIVAMVDDEVKQTRCSTCDADHEYKQARVPLTRRRKPGLSLPDSEARLPVPVLADAPGEPEADALPPAAPFIDDEAPLAMSDETLPGDDETLPGSDDTAASEEAVPHDEDWPVHRPLIRATLPRPEGQTPERKAPDFTLRQPGGRFDPNRNGGRGRTRPRHAQGGSGGQARFGTRQGTGPGGPGARHGNRPGDQAGSRAGRPQGQNRGNRQGGGGHGRKRGR